MKSCTIPLDARHQTRRAFIALVLGLAASTICAIFSGDGFHQFDEPAHYLFAKWAWQWPTYLLHDWGRPGFTFLHFIPARFGWTACRILSSIITAAAAWCAFRIAQALGIRHAWAVIVFAYAQPLNFELSFTTLTETPLALYLALSVLFAFRNRWTASAAILSLTFVTRHETLVFLPVWILLARLSGVRLRRLWPILWAPVVVELLRMAAGTPSISDKLTDFVPSEQFGRGSWLSYLARSLHAWGPGVTILAAVGQFRLASTTQSTPGGTGNQRLGPENLEKHDNRRTGLFVILPIAVYFTTHTVIRALGLFASGGYGRFLIGISPLVAVAALAGWNTLASGSCFLLEPRSRVRRRAMLVAGVTMILLWLSLERELSLPEVADSVAQYRGVLNRAVWAIRTATTAFITLVCFAWMQCGNGRRRPVFAVRPHYEKNPQLNLESRAPNLESQNSDLKPQISNLDSQASNHNSAGPNVKSKTLNPKSKTLAARMLSASLALMILLTCAVLHRPLTHGPEARIILRFRDWLSTSAVADRPIVTASLFVDYVLDRSRPPYGPLPRQELAEAPLHSLFVWDRRFAGAEDQNLPLVAIRSSPAFRPIFESRPRPWEAAPYLVVFEKIARWPPVAPPKPP